MYITRISKKDVGDLLDTLRDRLATIYDSRTITKFAPHKMSVLLSYLRHVQAGGAYTFTIDEIGIIREYAPDNPVNAQFGRYYTVPGDAWRLGYEVTIAEQSCFMTILGGRINPGTALRTGVLVAKDDRRCVVRVVAIQYNGQDVAVGGTRDQFVNYDDVYPSGMLPVTLIRSNYDRQRVQQRNEAIREARETRFSAMVLS